MSDYVGQTLTVGANRFTIYKMNESIDTPSAGSVDR